ncbi:MAG: serine hydrolase [Anaerolineales bacterium]|nr:serine hydrolase [Anaerolineales bacterium]
METSNSKSTFLPPDFDALIGKTMAEWNIPGMALAVVRDDQVLLSRGYGVREIGSDKPVTADTVFGIGSLTKSFTATALAALVSAGRLRWDDQVIDYFPSFRHPDPWVTRELTVRDMLCHRTGLPRGVHILLRGNYNLDTYLQRIRYLKPVASFRSQFYYTNTTFEAVGKMFPAAAGETWEAFMKNRIFDPLSMASSNTSVKELTGVENMAEPHAIIEGKVQTTPWRDIGNDASGSINSCAADLAQWLRLLVRQGISEGRTLIEPREVNETHAPQMIIRADQPDMKFFQALGLETDFVAYGLGWIVIDYHGTKLVFHPGGIGGYASLGAILPHQHTGMAFVSNLDENVTAPVLFAIMFTLVDLALELPPNDWLGRSLQLAKMAEEQQEAAWQKIVRSRVRGTSPSLPLDRFAGIYRDDFCGEMPVTVENGRLVIHFGPASKADLEHWHYDTFRATWRDPKFAPEFVTFALDKTGNVDTMLVETMARFERVEDSK